MEEKKNNILIIGPLPDPIDGCSYANFVLSENLKKRKIHFKIINTNTSKINGKQGQSFSFKKALNFFKVYFKIFKIIRSEVVYITPGQTFYGILKYSPFIIICIMLNKPFVIHIHGNYLGSQFKELSGVKKKIFHFLISKASAGIVLSESLRKNFNNLLDVKKVFVVENFAANEIYENSKELIKKADKIKMLYLSNLMKEKGILDVLDSMLILKQQHIDFHLTMAGLIEESIKSNISEKIKILGKNVKYVGVIKGLDKIRLLQESNIFILPTYYKMEGQPISIIEALATGNIIITTNHSGIPDIISNKNGYFVASKNPKDIASILIRISENLENQIEKFSDYNKLYASKNYTEEKFSNKIIDIINLVTN